MAEIKFVRSYKWYGEWVDVIYKSNRVYTYEANRAPRTVIDFMVKATNRREQHDRIFDRDEVIYTA